MTSQEQNELLETQLAQIVLARVAAARQRPDNTEHMLGLAGFRWRLQPLIGAIERLQTLGLTDKRNQLIRLQYLKQLDGIRIEFGRFAATLTALADDACRIVLTHNEGSLINVETRESVAYDALSEQFREIMQLIAAEGESVRGQV
jgi:hypothetical protein